MKIIPSAIASILMLNLLGGNFAAAQTPLRLQLQATAVSPRSQPAASNPGGTLKAGRFLTLGSGPVRPDLPAAAQPRLQQPKRVQLLPGLKIPPTAQGQRDPGFGARFQPSPTPIPRPHPRPDQLGRSLGQPWWSQHPDASPGSGPPSKSPRPKQEFTDWGELKPIPNNSRIPDDGGLPAREPSWTTIPAKRGDWIQPGRSQADDVWSPGGNPKGDAAGRGGLAGGGKIPDLHGDPFDGLSNPFGDRSGSFGGPSNPCGDKSSPFGDHSSPFGDSSNPFGDRSGPLSGSSDPFGDQSGPFGDSSSPFGDHSGPFGGPSDPFGDQSGPFGGSGVFSPGKGPAGADHVGKGTSGPLSDWYYTEGGPRWVKITEYHRGMAELEDMENNSQQDYGSGLLDEPREGFDQYPPSEEYHEREREMGEFLKAQEEFLREKQRMEELQRQKEQDENGDDDDDDDDDDENSQSCEGPEDTGGGRPRPSDIDPSSIRVPGELITDPAYPQGSGSGPWGAPPAGWYFTKDPNQASNPGPEGGSGGSKTVKGGVRFKGELITDPAEPEN